jgi:hypothetical protein
MYIPRRHRAWSGPASSTSMTLTRGMHHSIARCSSIWLTACTSSLLNQEAGVSIQVQASMTCCIDALQAATSGVKKRTAVMQQTYLLNNPKRARATGAIWTAWWLGGLKSGWNRMLLRSQVNPRCVAAVRGRGRGHMTTVCAASSSTVRKMRFMTCCCT